MRRPGPASAGPRPGRLSRVLGAGLALTLSILGGAGEALALSDEDLYRQFPFVFTAPGGRGQGMAGALSAVVDDATALAANPAALSLLDAPGVAFELRFIRPDTQVSSGRLGSLDVDLDTGERDLPYLGLSSVAQSDDTSGIGFLAVSWPFLLGRDQRRLTVALGGQSLLSEERSLSDGDSVTAATFAFPSFPNTVVGDAIQAYSVETEVSGSRRTDIDLWSLSGSYEVHPDFSVGVTLSYAALDLESASATQVVDPLQLFLDPTHPRRPGRPEADVYDTRVDATDSDLAWTVGVHLHPDSAFASGVSPWTFAVVYRKGAAFDYEQQTFLNGVPDQTFTTSLVVPDRYGLGIGYRTPRHWLLSLDVERVEYSDMLDGFVGGVNYLTSGRVAGEAFAVDPDQPVVYDVDDGIIPRLGVEYGRDLGARRDRRLSVWAGYFRQPDSRIRLSRFNSTDPAVNAAYESAFGGGLETDHFTLGAGLALGRHGFQLAGETSDLDTRLAASYVFRWRDPAAGSRNLGTLEMETGR